VNKRYLFIAAGVLVALAAQVFLKDEDMFVPRVLVTALGVGLAGAPYGSTSKGDK
jgi:hypothetical protein